jgi:hypothetical protein
MGKSSHTEYLSVLVRKLLGNFTYESFCNYALFCLSFINSKMVIMKTRLSFQAVFFLIIGAMIALAGCTPQTPGNIPFNEDSVRSHILPIQEAVRYTEHFRTARDSSYRQLPSLKGTLDFGQAEGFNRDAIAVLLNQQDASGARAAGIRIYYGLDEKGQVRMILVPYDEKGNDIIHELIGNKVVRIPGIPAASAFAANGQTIEDGQRCPVVCDSGISGLNGN